MEETATVLPATLEADTDQDVAEYATESDHLDDDGLDDNSAETSPRFTAASPAAVAWEHPVPRSTVREGLSRQAVVSLALGALALPLTLLAIFPGFWGKVPASLLGTAALFLGFHAESTIRRSRGKLCGRGLAHAGVILGIAGMLLGPGVISRLRLWEQRQQQMTVTNLAGIGAALESFHAREGHYPAGAILVRPANEPPRQLHGWLTQLLPFVGEEALFYEINHSLPYDDEANRTAMSQRVPAFLTGDGDLQPSRGLGITHFAGLGGEIQLPDGGIADVGIFEINSRIMHADVTHGLSQTLIVGELAGDYPPWGGLDNWRTIGRGLNRDPRGFGNAAGTGAHFLFADGTVRFFPNGTDVKVLEQLSTRNGE